MGLDQKPGRSGVSRRGFLQGAGTLALSGSLAGRRALGVDSLAGARQPGAAGSRKSILVYVGTYSSPQGPEGSTGNTATAPPA